MHMHRKLGSGLAVLACVCMLSSSAMSGHDWEEWLSNVVCFRTIDSSGNLDDAIFSSTPLAHLKYNTKTGHLHMKAERDGIPNSSCEPYNVHHIPGTAFCFPSSLGLDCHYRVSADDCDGDTDESAKLHGHNGDYWPDDD